MVEPQDDPGVSASAAGADLLVNAQDQGCLWLELHREEQVTC